MNYPLSIAVAMLFAFQSFAETPYPGATWQKRTFERSGGFDHNRQCDANGCLYTDTTQAFSRTMDQYYVPHSNVTAVPYYAPTPAVPGVYVNGAAGDYGPNGKYRDGYGNAISYAEFRRQTYGVNSPAPATTNAVPGVYYTGTNGDFGPAGKYKDGNGNSISYAEFRRQVYGK